MQEETESTQPAPGFKRADYKLLAVLGVLSLVAAMAMGGILGFMTGASESPVANAAIAGIFGIVAAMGGAKALHGAVSGRAGIIGAICVAIAILAFCGAFYLGLLKGGAARNELVIYTRSVDLVGSRLDYLDPEMAAELNAFRIKCRLAGVKPSDYEAAMIEAVRPIINDDKPERMQRLRAALAILETAITKPEPKTDGKPKPEPKEPAEPAGAKAD